MSVTRQDEERHPIDHERQSADIPVHGRSRRQVHADPAHDALPDHLERILISRGNALRSLSDLRKEDGRENAADSRTDHVHQEHDELLQRIILIPGHAAGKELRVKVHDEPETGAEQHRSGNPASDLKIHDAAHTDQDTGCCGFCQRCLHALPFFIT